MKPTIAVFFGGQTCEHDVSILTGLQALRALDPMKYRAIPVYIGRGGDWYAGDALRDIGAYKDFGPRAARRVVPVRAEGGMALYGHPEDRRLFGRYRRIERIDAAIPAMHGMNGEDGTLQGLFELMDVPFASAGVLGSAVGMDKIAMKRVFAASGIPVLPDVAVGRDLWESDREGVIREAEAALGYPMFVKPANLGSSIGISRAKDREGLIEAMGVAAAYDRRILIERGIEDLIEVNCAALGFGEGVRASVVEMPIRWDDAALLSFTNKYARGPNGKLGQEMRRRIPAPIGEELTERVRALTIQAFRAIDCKGVARVDFLLDQKDGSVYVGEINTIPGSLSNYLWSATGMTFSELMDELIRCAYAAHAEKRKNDYAYESEILLEAGASLKGAKGGVGWK